jgi:hypothetical protein
MRRSLLACASLALVAGSLTACGPDPLLGTYSYNSTTVTNLTQPTMTTQNDMGSGTATVTAGTGGSDYTVDFVASGATQHCVLNGTRNGSGMIFAAGQTCMFSSNYNGTPVNINATLTNGNGVLSGSALTITVAYTFTGNAGALALMGTGTQVLNCTPVAH